MDDTALDARLQDLVARLRLTPHPEGGWYRETHRSTVQLDRAALPEGYPGTRCAVTSILFLLPTGTRSRAHRVRSEEIFVHHAGDPLLLLAARAPGDLDERASKDAVDRFALTLGPRDGDTFQAIVPAGWWQAAEPVRGDHGYTLIGCIVAPGFEFEDFEMR